jgi:hypothetical protein
LKSRVEFLSVRVPQASRRKYTLAKVWPGMSCGATACESVLTNQLSLSLSLSIYLSVYLYIHIYIRKVCSTGNRHKMRLCINQLAKTLSPEALRKLTLCPLQAVTQHSLIQCSWWLYEAQLPQTVRIHCICREKVRGCHGPGQTARFWTGRGGDTGGVAQEGVKSLSKRVTARICN